MVVRLNDRSVRKLIATATRRRDVWDTVLPGSVFASPRAASARTSFAIA
jgi:hypothetical protein